MSNYFNPETRCVLVAASRSGSTFLQTALSNHTEIGCDRYEPLAAGSPYLTYLVPPSDEWSLCHALLARPGYKATVIKLSYRQFRNHGARRFLQGIGATHIIHLTRDNPLRIVFSAFVNTHVPGTPSLAYTASVSPDRVTIPTVVFIEQCDRYLENVAAMRDELTTCRLPLLTLTYEMITYDALSPAVNTNRVVHATAMTICTFLRVIDEGLFGITVRQHPGPLSLYIENWSEVSGALQVTPYAHYLEKELNYETEWNARANP